MIRRAFAALFACALFASPALAQTSSITGPFFAPKPKGDPNGIEAQIVNAIAAATQTVDVANYQWSSQPEIDALVAAAQNGIQVRVVADTASTTSTPYTDQLTAAGIQVVFRNGSTSSGIMHCKYLVFDNSSVWLGSANLTSGSSRDNCENGMLIASTQLAADFENDFNQMFGRQLWSENKTSPSPNPTVTINGPSGNPIQLDVYFSGEDAPSEYTVLSGLVDAATTSVQIMAYELKANKTGGTAQLVQSILNAASRGVTVQVILDDDNSVQQSINTAAFSAFQAAGISVVWFHPSSGYLHDKVIIVDGNTLEMGSFNYTEQAAYSQGDGNDEDFIVFHDAGIAYFYQQEFANIWQQAGGSGTAIVGAAPPGVTPPAPPPVPPVVAPVPSSSTTPRGTTAPGATAGAANASSGGGGGSCEVATGARSPLQLAPLLVALAALALRRRRG